MNFCNQCGSPIPEDESICLVCMGNITSEEDYYYEQWLEDQERKAYERQMEEEYYEELNYMDENY